MSLIGLLVATYNTSRRDTMTLLREMAGVQISLGATSAIVARVSEAVKPEVDEAWSRVGDAPVKHTDGTGGVQSGVAMAIWTIATAMVTVFKTVLNNSKETLKPLFGELKGNLISDRAGALNFWAMERRQICWAHLLRKFISFSERDGPAGEIGCDLVNSTALVFEYWHAYKDGKISYTTMMNFLKPVREGIEDQLRRAVAANLKRISGSCKNVLKHKGALWTFLEQVGVEPTNNHAEHELRAFVLWRKRCQGSRSERGNVFAERLMTVVHTARKQNLDVLTFLTQCCEAQAQNEPPPSMFAESEPLSSNDTTPPHPTSPPHPASPPQDSTGSDDDDPPCESARPGASV